jgi:hypothetical protein
LYNPQLYGQNQKTQRPYNWILVHLADKNSAVVVEVNNPDKDNAEIVNWHYIGGAELERKKEKPPRRVGLSSHYPKILQLPILMTTCYLKAKLILYHQINKKLARKVRQLRPEAWRVSQRMVDRQHGVPPKEEHSTP